MQLDVIAVNVGEMLADLGDAYGKWHLTPGTMHSSSQGLTAGCTRRGRGARQYRPHSVRPGQLCRALESPAVCLERVHGPASVCWTVSAVRQSMSTQEKRPCDLFLADTGGKRKRCSYFTQHGGYLENQERRGGARSYLLPECRRGPEERAPPAAWLPRLSLSPPLPHAHTSHAPSAGRRQQALLVL